MRSCSHERLGAAFLNQVSILIQNFSVPCNDATPSSCLTLQRNNDRQGVDRVPKDDWSVEFPFEDCQERQGVDTRSLAHEARGDGQTKQSMGHGPAEGIASGARNLNFGLLPLANTILWGIVLGYSFLRSGDLWLPIGLHFGWNWTLPLLGVNLGHVGFLAEAEPEDLPAAAEHLVDRDYLVQERMTIDVTVRLNGDQLAATWALNEATVEKAAREARRQAKIKN